MSRRANKKHIDAWADDVEEAPRAELPEDKSEKRRRWMRWYFLSMGFAMPVIVFAGFVSTQEMASSIEDLSAPSAMGEESSAVVESRAAATIAVEEWLSAEPSPLPQGRVLSWNWAQEVPDLKEPERGSGGEIEPWDTIIAHDFTVVGKSTTFSVQVNTLVDPVGGVLVMGTPSLLPYAPAASGVSAQALWPGAMSVSASEAVEQAINQWAKTFVGGEPRDLRLVVGDPVATHSYMPMVGAEFHSSEVTEATVQPEMYTPEGQVPPDPEQIVARVELTILWGEEDELDDRGDVRELQVISYDVLVDRANTAAPQVVAWGGAGSGPTLEAYQNAVDGRELVMSSTSSDDEESDGEQGTEIGETQDTADEESEDAESDKEEPKKEKKSKKEKEAKKKNDDKKKDK